MALKRVRLAQRRKAIGYTQEHLAADLGIERSTVARWERALSLPHPWLRPMMAQALQVSLEELDDLLADVRFVPDGPGIEPQRDPVLSAPWSQRGTVEASVALGGGGGPMERRSFLYLTGAALTAPAYQWLTQEPGRLTSALSGDRVPAELADRFPIMIAQLREMDDVAGGDNVLALVQRHFEWVTGMLDTASYDERTGRNLHVALAELGQLAGWTAFDAGQQGLAQRYYTTALRAAHNADDRPLGAHILGSMAFQAARQGRPADAVALIDTALDGAHGQATPRLLATLYIRQAHGWAALGDASACTAAISKARAYIEQSEPADEPPWLYWARPAEITASAGHCLLHLGKADQAVPLLDEGIGLFGEPFHRDRLNYLTHLADALARPGAHRDLDAAASHGIAAIELTESVTSTRSVGHVRDLYRQLKPHASLPTVTDFLDRAQQLLAA